MPVPGAPAETRREAGPPADTYERHTLFTIWSYQFVIFFPMYALHSPFFPHKKPETPG